jgi:hypothetical protein
VTLLDVIRPTDFDVCPICLTESPTTEEHVPPESIGGRRATLTCAECNHRFGVFEAELALHTRNALRGPAFTGPGVQGNRRASEFSIAFQEDGSPAYILHRPDKAVMEMLKSGRMQMSFSLPRAALWRTALLKHAYLAACLYLQEVPDTRHARHLRSELLQARDAGASHETGVFASALRTMRGYGDAPTQLYLAGVSEHGRIYGFVGLGKHWTVAWPMPDTVPLLGARLKERRA